MMLASPNKHIPDQGRRRILLLVALPNFSYDNPHSAVAGYMRFLGAALEAVGYEVLWSHKRGTHTPTPKPSGRIGWVGKLKGWLRKAWPWAYHSLLNTRYLRQQAAILDQLPEGSYDQVLEFLVYGSDLGLRLKQQTGAKLSVIYDSPLNTQFFEMHGTYSAVKRLIDKRELDSVSGADHLLTYSNPVKNYLAKQTSLPTQTTVLPCLLWKKVPVRNEQPDQPSIGFIGSFLRWHQVDILVEAFAELADEFPRVKLKLIGYGEEWHRVKAQVEQLPCRDRIYMPGFVDEAELMVIKSRMTVGVMPGSNWYGSPLKLFEYAQAGIPMIAPSSPTVLDVFEGKDTALFIDPDVPKESLIQHLRTLLTDHAYRQELGQRGKDLMETKMSQEAYRRAFLEAIDIQHTTPTIA